MRTATVAFALIWISGALAGEAPSAFTRKPTAAKANGKVRIEFAVNRETDVAVYVENSAGKTVRHLVAGVLGKNAPAPLKPGLAQSVAWDLRDDRGRPAKGGPFKVRVALGLNAKFDRVLIGDRQALGGVRALAAAPDGTLYVFTGFGAHVPNYDGLQVMAFGRDGKYVRTVLPPPAGTAPEDWKGLGGTAVKLDTGPAPVVLSMQGRRFFDLVVGRKSAAAVTPGGQVLVAGSDLAAITPEGKAAWGKLHGPVLLPKERRSSLHWHAGLAVSPDGASAYVTGLRATSTGSSPGLPAVYRVGLPGRGPAEVFFGDPKKPGKGESGLAAGPRGLAVDGEGRLLVCDHGNGRVVVLDGKSADVAGELKVPGPHAVGVDPTGGTVYVLSLPKGGSGDLIKYDGWKSGRELARLPIKKD
ncbi:MAG: YncE family protein, partial [Planctomycetota bacterium]